MPSENSTLTSSIASSVIVISMSMVSAAFATDIHRPDEMVSASSGGAVMLQSVDVTTWIDEALLADAPTWLHAARHRIDELGQLPDGWGGSEKPNEYALRVALSLVERMESLGHRYLRIAPMADGGIAVRYLEGARSARFDIYNEGEIVVATREDSGIRPEYKELSEADAVDELSQFLQRDDAASVG